MTYIQIHKADQFLKSYMFNDIKWEASNGIWTKIIFGCVNTVVGKSQNVLK